MNYKNLIRPVIKLTENISTPIVWKDNFDLLLAIEKDSERTYLTVDEYKAKSDIADYKVLGVVVAYGIYPSNRFIIALNDEPTDAMIWSMASQLYPNNLPTPNQGRIISAHWSRINAAIKGFGGTVMSSPIWLNTASNGYGYYTNNSGGDIYTVGSTNYTNKVRLVYPF